MGLVALQRLFELRLANRNAAALLKRHAVEAGKAHYPLMVALHTLFLAACVAEVWLLSRPLFAWLAVPGLVVFVAAQALRYWAIRSLGDRWTTRVLFVPGTLEVVRGPYRHVRHPNYVAVISEIAAIPLVHTAWLTAIVFSLANSLLLAERIRVEEQLIREVSGYKGAHDGKPRFVPRA